MNLNPKVSTVYSSKRSASAIARNCFPARVVVSAAGGYRVTTKSAAARANARIVSR